MRLKSILLIALGVSGAADAQPLRELCADRPGLGTPACTVDRGHLQIEAGVGDWTLDRQPDTRTDRILAGDVAARYGVGDTTELRIGWTALGHVRERDRASAAVERSSGVGDVTLGLKQNLMNPDGDKLSIALLPFATLPAGGHAIGAGDWGAGLIAPVDYQLSDAMQLQFSPEVDAAVDEDRDGRHLAYGGVVGLGIDLTESVAAAVEAQAMRDDDPAGHATMALAGLSLAWRPEPRTQLDVGANAGLNHVTPDIELYVGVSRKF